MPLTLHIVPHTHWDREWYLPYQVFRIRLIHLMDRLLDILGSDGAFRHFMLDGQSILLEDYLEIRPERAAEIARLVRTERLTIGPWYVLPDEFLVAPESLVRNLMLGDQVCSRFGNKMRIGYVPDPFGHVSQLPQILKGFGIESAAFRRGLDEEPAELWWEAPDGSRVLACYLRDSYDNAARLPTSDRDAFVAAIHNIRDSLAPHVTSGNALLLAGTDHQEPQPEIPQLVAYANRGRLHEDRLIHSNLPDFVQAVREAIESGLALETIVGELRSPQRHHLLPGVLSTRMWIKQQNDAIETLLTRWAEPFAAWAELVDPEFSALGGQQETHLTGHEPLRRVRRSGALIWHAWRLLLENHPHDSICGCSIDQVHREMMVRFDQAEQIVEEVTVQSLTTIADQVDTCLPDPQRAASAPSQPLIVFNPTNGPRTDVVTAQLNLPGAHETLQVVNASGQVVPHQIVADPTGTERSLFHLEATPEEVAGYMDLVEAGHVLNHVIHHIEFRQIDDEAKVRLVISERGEPDYDHLSAIRAQFEELIASGSVSRFDIHGVVAETKDLVFLATDLPGYGLATFYLKSVPSVDNAGDQATANANTIENDLFHIQASAVDGTLTLTDKGSGVVYPGLNFFVDDGDRGDEYNYCQPEEDKIIAGPVAPPGIMVIEDGPARKILQVVQLYRVPRSLRADRRGRLEGANSQESTQVDVPIVSQVSLYPDVRRVDIQTTVDNQAQDHRLRVLFPVPAKVDQAYAEAHYHVARRPVPQIPAGLDTHDWVEQPAATVPQRGWAEVSDGRAGLLVANRGLPEVEFIPDGEQTVIALTLLRCVGWLSRDDMHCRQGHAGPAIPTPEAQCPGRHTFHYALIPYAWGLPGPEGSSGQARIQAEAFRTLPRVVVTGIHSGDLPPVASLIHAEPSAFLVTAVKQPEEKSTPGLLVRGVNMSPHAITVRIRPWRSFGQVSRTNLNEEFVEPLLAATDGTVTVSAHPWEVVTLRWRGA